jgi:hypothetical protein
MFPCAKKIDDPVNPRFHHSGAFVANVRAVVVVAEEDESTHYHESPHQRTKADSLVGSARPNGSEAHGNIVLFLLQ